MDARQGYRPARPETARRRLRLLGAILAGGQSLRFGSDKALALYHGKPLIEHVAKALLPQVNELVVAGSDHPPYRSVADWPDAGEGPLGGLCGALLYAEQHGYDAVLSTPCDAVSVPRLNDLLPSSGGVLRGWPLFGLWPTVLLPTLQRHLSESADRSVFGWIAVANLPELPAPEGLVNVNRPGDLDI